MSFFLVSLVNMDGKQLQCLKCKSNNKIPIKSSYTLLCDADTYNNNNNDLIYREGSTGQYPIFSRVLKLKVVEDRHSRYPRVWPWFPIPELLRPTLLLL